MKIFVGLTAEYPSTNLHKNSVYCILTLFVKKRVYQFKEIAQYGSLVHRRKTNFDRPSFWNFVVVVVVKTPIRHPDNLS